MVQLRIASWNVNGIRSYIVDSLPCGKFKTKTEISENSNLGHLIEVYNPNIICFQETRCGPENMLKFTLSDWKIYSSSSEGTGGRGPNRYSGVAIWVHNSLQLTPIGVYNILPTLTEPITISDKEGRFLALEFNNFTIINTYVPNAGTNYTYRTERWDPAMCSYLSDQQTKDTMTIWVGDLNVARTPYDVHFGNITNTPQGRRVLGSNQSDTDKITQLQTLTEKYHNNDIMLGIGEKALPGFTKAERDGINKILELSYLDCWRQLNPINYYQGYTWWNQRIPIQRENNQGWRIDYIITNSSNIDKLVDCYVLPEIGTRSKQSPTINKFGSDHAPICATFNIS